MIRFRLAVTLASFLSGVAAVPTQDAAKAELDRLGYSVDDDGLRRAVRYQDRKLIRLYLAAGLSADLTDSEGVPLLVDAARRGHVETVRLLLEGGADVHARGKGRETALEVAVSGGRTDIVPLLIAQGADVNAATLEGTAATRAASAGDARLLQALIDGGADLDATADPQGMTPLIFAAGQGHAEVVRVLVRGGANVNKRTPTGWSALASAVWGGHLEVVHLLLEAGARMEPKERSELLASASEHGYVEIRKLLEASAPPPRPSPRPKP